MLQQAWYSTERIAVAAYAQMALQMNISRHAPLPQGPKIITANHPTTTDPILITLAASETMHILITEMCFKVPVLGHLLRQAGHVPVVDDNRRAAFDEAIQLLKEGKTVGIFPEGALSPPDGGAGHPHTGVARMALMAGAPIIPVGIHVESERIKFIETTMGGKTETARWYLRGPYAMTLGKPMWFEGDVEDRQYVRATSEHIMQRIVRLARESEQRMHTPQTFDPRATQPVRLETGTSRPPLRGFQESV